MRGPVLLKCVQGREFSRHHGRGQQKIKLDTSSAVKSTPSDNFAIVGYLFAVAGTIQLPQLRGLSQRFNGFFQHLNIEISIGAAKFLERGHQFFEMLGAGVLALQPSRCFNQLALSGAGLVVGKFFGNGDPVATRALGHVHAGVGDANDVFHWKNR